MTEIIHRLSVERIVEAGALIDPVFLNTPQFVCEPLGDALGVRVALKIETLNPIRSFKGRGADLLVARTTSDAPLICASAGNFGQAMAYACRKRGLALTVYAATSANPLKVERMEALGARVMRAGADFDAAKLAARRAAQDSGVRFVEDSRDVETVDRRRTLGARRHDRRGDAPLASSRRAGGGAVSGRRHCRAHGTSARIRGPTRGHHRLRRQPDGRADPRVAVATPRDGPHAAARCPPDRGSRPSR